MINIPAGLLEKVRVILRKYIPDMSVCAFGSRVKGNSEDYSDLDIAVLGDNGLEFSVYTRLKEEFEESDLPFRVDIVDYSKVSPEFKKIISETGEPINIVD
ncbi:MAG: nucleotidyltransferase domain-containing protein [Brevinematales bacterium]|nr:nucleotidyltransferase domain-containing protein [Brevinematales bacterium]